MKRRTKLSSAALLLMPLCGIACCLMRPLSVRHDDPTAGLNGGFEVARDGLPVNWLIYAPETVPDAVFRVDLDPEDCVEGATSLRFVVEDCRPARGGLAPGIARELPAERGGSYRLRFWIQSDGADWVATHRAVSPKSGAPPVEVRGAATVWRQVERVYRMPASDMDRLRFELNVLSPGTVRIDWFTIERLDPVPAEERG